MNLLELYKFYRAVKLHFESTKYDYFKYSGAVQGATVDNYNNLSTKEKYSLEKIQKLREPKTYVVGNLLFNKSNFIGDFTDTYYLEYRKYIVNGNYIFAEELKLLDLDNFLDNFKVDSNSSVPYILQLFIQNKISLFTCCVFEKIMSWTSKLESNILIEDKINKICKSIGFFKIDPMEYKKIVVNNINGDLHRLQRS